MPLQNYQTVVYEDLRQMFRVSVSQWERKIFLTQYTGDVRQAISYRGFLSRVNALGTALYRMGFQGKKIMIMGSNSIDWVTCYMAVVCGLGVAVPVSRELSCEAFQTLLEKSDTQVVILSEKSKNRLGSIPKNISVVLFEQIPELTQQGRAAIKKGDRDFLDAPIDPQAMTVLLYPTGTSAGSHGVMLSHRNLCFNLSEICKMIHIEDTDVFLSVLPLHHAYETTCGFLCPLYCGASVVFARKIRHLQEDLRENRPTVLLSVPLLTETLWRNYLSRMEKKGLEGKVQKAIALCRKFPSDPMRRRLQKQLITEENRPFGGNLRLIISGGAAADPAVLSALCGMGITALQGYCMTECSPMISLNRDAFHNHASAGLATPETLLDITHIHSDGTGEIRFRGDNVMLGYYKEPEETAACIKGGWFYTGDLGYMDENGFLYITGRKQNVIVTEGGRNVYPEDLEAALERTPYVEEAVVTGVFNAKRKNSEVIALIRPDEEALRDVYGEDKWEEMLLLEMKKAVSGVNAATQSHQQIKGFLIRKTEFDRNTSGMILRHGIAEEAAVGVKQGLLYR